MNRPGVTLRIAVLYRKKKTRKEIAAYLFEKYGKEWEIRTPKEMEWLIAGHLIRFSRKNWVRLFEGKGRDEITKAYEGWKAKRMQMKNPNPREGKSHQKKTIESRPRKQNGHFSKSRELVTQIKNILEKKDRRAVTYILSRLTNPQREVVELAILQRQDVFDIAVQLNIEPSVLFHRLRLAHARIITLADY